jgi:hypothetical protein
MKWLRQYIRRFCHEKYPDFANSSRPGRSSPDGGRDMTDGTTRADHHKKTGKAGRCKIESREFDPCTTLWLHFLYALEVAVNPLAQLLARLEMRYML